MAEQKINIRGTEQAAALFGNLDENVKWICKEYDVSIIGRGEEIRITGEPENVAKAAQVVESLLRLIDRGEALNEQNIRYCMSLAQE